MKKIFLPLTLVLLFACTNSKKDDKASATEIKKAEQSTNTSSASSTPVYNTKYNVEGKEINTSGSLLVTKDKDKLQPGADYFCMLTARSSGPDREGLTLNFLLALKPGVYPVVGTSFNRGPSGKGEVYGGLMGGKPKLTDYKITITECKDLGSNNLGGHKWSLSGTFENIVIPAMALMLMDKTKNHPKEVKIDSGSFTNLTFDDNWEEMMKQAMEKMQGKKN